MNYIYNPKMHCEVAGKKILVKGCVIFFGDFASEHLALIFSAHFTPIEILALFYAFCNHFWFTFLNWDIGAILFGLINADLSWNLSTILYWNFFWNLFTNSSGYILAFLFRNFCALLLWYFSTLFLWDFAYNLLAFFVRDFSAHSPGKLKNNIDI